MADRAIALNALVYLAQFDRDAAEKVGAHMEHLEDMNERLAQRAAAAVNVLENGKRDLMHDGWCAAWVTLQNDPNRINGDPDAEFTTAYAHFQEGA